MKLQLTAVFFVATGISLYGQAAPAPQAPRTPKSGAPIDLTGYWVSIVTEDWRYRMVTPPKGDYASVPITPEAKKVADAWDPAKDEAAGEQCRSYGAPAIMRVPGRLHITWDDDNTLHMDTDAGKQTRLFHFDPKAPRPPASMRTDFDAIEVYNGFDTPLPERLDAVLKDWFALLNQGYRYVATGSSDSHRIQYQWAGYPRTMVAVPVTAPVDEAAGIDPLAVVSALKKGHAYVTSGPIVDLDIDGAHAGDEAPVRDGTVRAHVVVRAAPWIDVTSVDIVVEGRVVTTIPIPGHPTVVGPETGSLEDAQLRTLRLEDTVAIDVGPGDAWVLVVARGTRKLDDVLPFMPVPPRAFTNPVWLMHDPANFFGPPRPRRPAH